MVPTGDLAHNPGMCPDWELNWQPFGSQPALSPPNYINQGPFKFFLKLRFIDYAFTVVLVSLSLLPFT